MIWPCTAFFDKMKEILGISVGIHSISSHMPYAMGAILIVHPHQYAWIFIARQAAMRPLKNHPAP